MNLSVQQFKDIFTLTSPSEEYILQSTTFLTSMREMLQTVRDSPQYQRYQVRYKSLVAQKKLTKED